MQPLSREVIMDKTKGGEAKTPPAGLRLTVPTKPWAATVGLEKARVVKGMTEVLPKALQLKDHPLSLFHAKLPFTRLTEAIGGQGGTGVSLAC